MNIQSIKVNLRNILFLWKDLNESLSPEEVEDADKVDQAALQGRKISDYDKPNWERVCSEEFLCTEQAYHFERLIYEEIAEPNKSGELLYVDIDKVRKVMDELPDEVRDLFWQIIRHQWYGEKSTLTSLKFKNNPVAIHLISRSGWLGVGLEELIKTINPYCLDKG